MDQSDDPIMEGRTMQADPQLRLSQGHATRPQVIAVTLGCVLIVGLMIYGLSREVPEKFMASSPPAGAATTGSAPRDQAPQQQVPQQLKPGVVEDDSKR
jgi:hypothetical protein